MTQSYRLSVSVTECVCNIYGLSWKVCQCDTKLWTTTVLGSTHVTQSYGLSLSWVARVYVIQSYGLSLSWVARVYVTQSYGLSLAACVCV